MTAALRAALKNPHQHKESGSEGPDRQHCFESAHLLKLMILKRLFSLWIRMVWTS
ncbi:hypothetical protein I79_014269 [Cricetulus griseus]|uniref:Uncharacterized protein n=1 Tax=Cricetulus griseus TaxID=10029 RepID=G3HTP1_CRIGR|nr:hypothetical protein I79_014269 [Cricetulus griseus]